MNSSSVLVKWTKNEQKKNQNEQNWTKKRYTIHKCLNITALTLLRWWFSCANDSVLRLCAAVTVGSAAALSWAFAGGKKMLPVTSRAVGKAEVYWVLVFCLIMLEKWIVTTIVVVLKNVAFLPHSSLELPKLILVKTATLIKGKPIFYFHGTYATASVQMYIESN